MHMSIPNTLAPTLRYLPTCPTNGVWGGHGVSKNQRYAPYPRVFALCLGQIGDQSKRYPVPLPTP